MTWAEIVRKTLIYMIVTGIHVTGLKLAAVVFAV
jgi:hypothetical protein